MFLLHIFSKICFQKKDIPYIVMSVFRYSPEQIYNEYGKKVTIY